MFGVTLGHGEVLARLLLGHGVAPYGAQRLESTTVTRGTTVIYVGALRVGHRRRARRRGGGQGELRDAVLRHYGRSVGFTWSSRPPLVIERGVAVDESAASGFTFCFVFFFLGSPVCTEFVGGRYDGVSKNFFTKLFSRFCVCVLLTLRLWSCASSACDACRVLMAWVTRVEQALVVVARASCGGHVLILWKLNIKNTYKVLK